MPLLVLLFLTGACMPEARAYSAFNWDVETRVWATAALAAFGVFCASCLSFATIRAAHVSPERRTAAIRRYYAIRWALFFVNVGAALAAIFLVGWGQVVDVFVRVPWRGESVLAPFAELLVPATYLVNVIANWFVYYPAERALARTSSNKQRQSYWSLSRFVLSNARQFAVMILLPVLLFAGQLTLMRFFPELLNEWWYKFSSILAIAALFLLLPRLVKPLLGLKTLPAGPYRDQLEATEKRLKFRRTDLLLWPTQGVANALILGIVPQARYVIFTDTLLESLTPAELDAVFGHEIGHAHHGHLAYYAMFVLMSALALSGIIGVADVLAEGWGVYAAIPIPMQPLLKIVPLVMMGVYLFFVFGWLSRVCERQADIAGSRAGSCANPHCSGHEDGFTPLSPGGRGVGGEGATLLTSPLVGEVKNLCETGLRAMVMALEAVTGMNGLNTEAKRSFAAKWLAWFRSWQHGPPNARIQYLQSLMVQPELARIHERYAYRVRWGLALALVAVIAATASFIGWDELWKLL